MLRNSFENERGKRKGMKRKNVDFMNKEGKKGVVEKSS